MADAANAEWYALRTFNRREMDVKAWLEERGHETFVPMRLVERVRVEGEKPQRVFVPAIHNYLFCVKRLEARPMRTLAATCPWPLAILRKAGSDTEPYLVSAREMAEFRMLSDPDYREAQFLEADEAEARPGKEVLVTQGAFKGVRGKLVRVKNNYFLIKTFGGLAVQVHISRWYCKVLDTPVADAAPAAGNAFLRRI
ncbi:MAG: UpxY family transcription antiterminator [Bacteroidaceae bacterium]|nr:UpxY family transcription antiterminator [Bacteroidaceae bacterium]